MSTQSAKLNNEKMPTASSTASTRSSTATSIWVQLQSLMNAINHILIGLIALYITVLGRSLDFQNTAMHAFLTIIGFHVLMAEGLMSHYPINFVTNRFSHRAKSKIHGVLQLVGGSLALLGALGKISQTEVHFTTLHGKIGLAATFFCFASITGGMVNYFQPTMALKLYTPATIKCRHNFFGMVTFTLGMMTIFLGYRTKFAYKYMDLEFIAVISLATILVYIFTMIGPLRSFLDKMKYRKQFRR